jgi:hypothetical protein
VAWWKEADGYGFAINYPDVMVHAVSRDLEKFPHPCLYCYLDVVDEDGEPLPAEEGTALAAAQTQKAVVRPHARLKSPRRDQRL